MTDREREIDIAPLSTCGREMNKGREGGSKTEREGEAETLGKGEREGKRGDIFPIRLSHKVINCTVNYFMGFL